MSLKVLLADDNITAQRMGCKILSDAGYNVIAVSNGAAAMKKIASEKPALIILDVYMPGYTGLEVCEKVKSAAETARVPVLLTITSMEPFQPADGNRVKADGVLTKPFEATDLLAVVRKLEEKLHLAEPAGVETTTKLEAVPDFSDPSYAEWKAEAGPDEPAARAAEMSHEVGSAPVLGIEGLAPGSDPASTFAVESAPGPFAVESQPAEVPAFDLGAPAPAFDLQHAESHDAAPAIAPPAELEYTSAPQAGPAEVAPAAELEPTMQAGAEEVPVVQESALATDPSDFMQFATRFGQEHPEEIPVGNAMEEPPHDDALAPVSEFVAESRQEHPEEIPVGIAMEEPPHDDAPAPVSEFVAESGQEHPEEIPVGIAMEEFPHDDALTEIHEFVAESGQVAEPTSFEQEMRQAFETSSGSAAAVAPAPELEPDAEAGIDTQPLEIFPEPYPAPAVEIEAAPEPPAENRELTRKLVAQFAAELEAAQSEAPPEMLHDMEPQAPAAAAIPMDKQHVAEAVDRVLERYKDELVAAILRELHF